MVAKISKKNLNAKFFCKKLQMDVDIKPYLQGITPLSEVARTLSCRALNGEGVVLRICQVASPKAHDNGAEVVVGVGSEQGIEVLAVGIGFVPPCLTLACDSFSKGKLSDVGIKHDTEGVLRYEGHVIVIEIPMIGHT